MKAYGITNDQLRATVAEVSRKRYADNLTLNYSEPHNTHVSFTLRVDSSKGPGHRIGHTGKRMIAACWHAHRDVMKALFARYPEMRLVSALANYRSESDFIRSFEATGDKNIGSMARPMFMSEACECHKGGKL